MTALAPPPGVRVGKLNRLFVSYVPGHLLFTRKQIAGVELKRVRVRRFRQGEPTTRYVPTWVARLAKVFTYRSSVTQYEELIKACISLAERTPEAERMQLVEALDTVAIHAGFPGLEAYVGVQQKLRLDSPP